MGVRGSRFAAPGSKLSHATKRWFFRRVSFSRNSEFSSLKRLFLVVGDVVWTEERLSELQSPRHLRNRFGEKNPQIVAGQHPMTSRRRSDMIRSHGLHALLHLVRPR